MKERFLCVLFKTSFIRSLNFELTQKLTHLTFFYLLFLFLIKTCFLSCFLGHNLSRQIFYRMHFKYQMDKVY